MFQKFNNLKLRTKMLLSICSVAWLAFTLTIYYIGSNSRQLAEQEALDKARESAYRYASRVQEKLGSAMDTARTLTQSFEGMKQQGVPPRDMMDGILKQVLIDNPDFLAVWTCWEPNALDGKDSDFVDAFGHDETGRYTPYWYRAEGEIDVEPFEGYAVEGKRNYYLETLKSGQESIFNPDFSIEDRTKATSVLTVPVRFSGKVVAVVGIELPVLSFEPIVKDIHLYETGYGFLVSSDGSPVAHPTTRTVLGEPMEKFGFSPEFIAKVKNGKEASQFSVSKVTNKRTYYVFAPVAIGSANNKWSLGVNFPIEEVLREPQQLFIRTLVVGNIAVLLLLGVVYLISNGISRPVVEIANVVNKVASDRDLTLEVPVKTRDEVGTMAKEFNNMIGEMRESMKVANVAASGVDGFSAEVSKRATANKERAAEEERQMGIIQDTVNQMGATAGEVAQFSHSQRDAANLSYRRVEEPY